MFLGFITLLRGAGIKVSLTEWLTLMRALVQGHGQCSLQTLYHLGRAVLIKREGQYDLYDRVFASYFEGVEDRFDVNEEVLNWLQNPKLPRTLTEAEKEQLKIWDLDQLRDQFMQRLREQNERHDGGSKWVGTGGTSPFGHGGYHPAGIRMGGPGQNRSAVQIAGERKFRNLRSDVVLDTRQIGMALRKLRQLGNSQGEAVIDIDESIKASAKNGGEIDLVCKKERANRLKVMLLMDVGGSMDAYAATCERLFSAANAAHHFKEFKTYFFHNCIYETLYNDVNRWAGKSTKDILNSLDQNWCVVIVGDAWMAPAELIYAGGNIFYDRHNNKPGIEWLKDLRHACPNSVWLNPESQAIWGDPSVQMVQQVFPMFAMTLNGLGDAINMLRGAQSNRPYANNTHNYNSY